MSETLVLVLPFFFVFAIVYGSLEVSNVFKNNAVKAVISLVLAFFAITNADVIELINQVFPYAVILFIALFFIGFVLKLVGGQGSKDYSLIIIVVGLILILLASQGDLVELMNSVNSDIISYVGLGLILIIFYAAYMQQKGQK